MRTEETLSGKAEKPIAKPEEAIAYRLKDVPRVAGISRSQAYKLVAEGKLELRKIGASSLITADSLRRLFDNAA